MSELVSSLKAVRLEKGLSQRELSELSGVPQAQISKLENGQADVRISTFVAISRALGQEVEIIPRKYIPAVQAIIRRSHSGAARNPYAFGRNALADLASSQNALKDALGGNALAALASPQNALKDALGGNALAALASPQNALKDGLGRNALTDSSERSAYSLTDDDDE